MKIIILAASLHWAEGENILSVWTPRSLTDFDTEMGVPSWRTFKLTTTLWCCSSAVRSKNSHRHCLVFSSSQLSLRCYPPILPLLLLQQLLPQYPCRISTCMPYNSWNISYTISAGVFSRRRNITMSICWKSHTAVAKGNVPRLHLKVFPFYFIKMYPLNR